MVIQFESKSVIVHVTSTTGTFAIEASSDETIANILPRIAHVSKLRADGIEICSDSGEVILPNELIGSLRMLHLVARGRCGGEVDKSQTSDSPENLPQFWRRSWRDLRHNLYLLWPVLVAIFIYWLVSGITLHWVESRLPVPQALYVTWITMTTVGFGDITPATFSGRILVSIDAFVGILLVGIVLWLITSSLQKN